MLTLGFVILLAAGFVRAGSSTNASLSEREETLQTHKLADNGVVPRTSRSESDEVAYWHDLAVKRLKGWHRVELQRNDLRRQLLHRPTTAEAIDLACATYGHCTELWRKARCESHLFARAQNPSGASGLFQFLPSTFRSTPYGGFSIFSPYANALAGGWMHAHGRAGEWVCR